MADLKHSFRLISGKRVIKLDVPKLMGILNVTPDSFSNGAQFLQHNKALDHARSMIAAGADWLDIGGESSGPGSNDISLDEELSRVIPVIEQIRLESDIWLSVDTWKSQVALEAVRAGVDCINDITALRGDSKMADVVSKFGCAVILMYSKDVSRTTQKEVVYDDLIGTLLSFFQERIVYAESNLITKNSILLDPGMGHFISASAEYSFEIIRRLGELKTLGFPLVLGPSRKSFLACVSSGSCLAVTERDIPCAAVSSIAIWQGVKVLRMHEVAQGRLILDTLLKLGIPETVVLPGTR